MQCRCSIVDARGIGHTAKGGKLLVKTVGKFPAGVRRLLTDRLDRLKILFPVFPIVSGQIDSFQHFLYPLF